MPISGLRRNLLVLAAVLGLLFLHHRVALSGEVDGWSIVETRGDARMENAGNVVAKLSAGNIVSPGSRLETGPDGRLILARGESSITVESGSRMEIPTNSDSGLRTMILQTAGALLFKVDKRPTQHFEVRTPYLAAIVKGTTFAVSVDSETAAVDVDESAVEIAALGSGESGLVRPGHKAVVSAKGKLKLSAIGSDTDNGRNARGRQADQDANEQNGKKDHSEDSQASHGNHGRAIDDRATEPASRGRGHVKHLTVALGETSIDIAKVTGGFISNAALGSKAGASGKSSAASVSGAKALGNPGGGHANEHNGNPGGSHGNAYANGHGGHPGAGNGNGNGNGGGNGNGNGGGGNGKGHGKGRDD